MLILLRTLNKYKIYLVRNSNRALQGYNDGNHKRFEIMICRCNNEHNLINKSNILQAVKMSIHWQSLHYIRMHEIKIRQISSVLDINYLCTKSMYSLSYDLMS